MVMRCGLNNSINNYNNNDNSNNKLREYLHYERRKLSGMKKNCSFWQSAENVEKTSPHTHANC